MSKNPPTKTCAQYTYCGTSSVGCTEDDDEATKATQPTATTAKTLNLTEGDLMSEECPDEGALTTGCTDDHLAQILLEEESDGNDQIELDHDGDVKGEEEEASASSGTFYWSTTSFSSSVVMWIVSSSFYYTLLPFLLS
jgi:hypothetical protein